MGAIPADQDAKKVLVVLLEVESKEPWFMVEASEKTLYNVAP